jgi:alanine racemase
MRPWLWIDLDAVVENTRLLARLAAPAKLCAVVKADAYGHGLVPVAQALAGAGIDGLSFAVFAAAEGVKLRKAGIRSPILVLGPTDDDDLSDAAAARLECAVLTLEDVERFASHRLRVHLKIDTGLTRFGVRPEDAPAVLERCRAAGLEAAGLYSHLANAEELDESFSLEQTERLTGIPVDGAPLVRHIAASAAAMLWPKTRLDMVRCGIALYGRWPSEPVRRALPDVELNPALGWFARIAQVRDVAAGERVGYGCEFAPERSSVIAIVAAGYADGLPRSAGGGKLHARIGDGRAPIVGRICMNACMVDVTDLPARPAFHDVVEIDVEDAAAAAGTINYEILARFGPEVERRYG